MVPACEKIMIPRVAVLVPCYNEEAAIAAVVRDFRRVLPGAVIYVYDNNSRDQTAAKARERKEAGRPAGEFVLAARIPLMPAGDDAGEFCAYGVIGRPSSHLA